MVTTAEMLADVTPTEAAHVLNHFGAGGMCPGSFTGALINAFALADRINAARLSMVYPGIGAAMDAARNRADGIDVLRRIATLTSVA
jgi:hypothetical protein